MTAPKSAIKFSPVQTISMKDHPEISEAWLQQVIYDNPRLLGLGTVDARDKERVQPSGGRLDLLLQDDDSATRYEVELQLGPTDESHIIRTIEYWDVERKRYPNYEHVAVIVAEDITSRFFNVISLFNSAIPLIALKVTAVKNADGSIGLLFTRVLDLANQRSAEDDEPTEQADRSFWEKKKNIPKAILDAVEKVLPSIQEFEPKAQISYNKHYLGIWVDGKANNFVTFRPRQTFFYAEVRLEQNADLDMRMKKSLDLSYDRRTGRYKVHLTGSPSEESLKALQYLLHKAYDPDFSDRSATQPPTQSAV